MRNDPVYTKALTPFIPLIFFKTCVRLARGSSQMQYCTPLANRQSCAAFARKQVSDQVVEKPAEIAIPVARQALMFGTGQTARDYSYTLRSWLCNFQLYFQISDTCLHAYFSN